MWGYIYRDRRDSFWHLARGSAWQGKEEWSELLLLNKGFSSHEILGDFLYSKKRQFRLHRPSDGTGHRTRMNNEMYYSPIKGLGSSTLSVVDLTPSLLSTKLYHSFKFPHIITFWKHINIKYRCSSTTTNRLRSEATKFQLALAYCYSLPLLCGIGRISSILARV